jgi:hypothetical protein
MPNKPPCALSERDSLKRAWSSMLHQKGLGRDAGRDKGHRKLAYGHTYYDTDGSLFGQEAYAFPGLDPTIELVRLSELLSARRRIYRKPSARIRPLRESPRRRVSSGGGRRVDMSTGQTVGYVGPDSNFRETERRIGKIGAGPIFLQ